MRTLVKKNLNYVIQSLPIIEVLAMPLISPFECVYGVKPFMPITLIDLPKNDRIHGDAWKQAEALLRIHQQVQNNIRTANEKYKQIEDKGQKERRHFQVGDFVWLYLRKRNILNKEKIS